MKKPIKIVISLIIILFAIWGFLTLVIYMVSEVVKYNQKSEADSVELVKGVYRSNFYNVDFNKKTNAYFITDYEKNKTYTFQAESMVVRYDLDLFTCVDKKTDIKYFLVHFFTETTDESVNGRFIVLKIENDKLDGVFTTESVGISEINDFYVILKDTKIKTSGFGQTVAFPFYFKIENNKILFMPVTNAVFEKSLKNAVELGFSTSMNGYEEFYRMIMESKDEIE